MLAFISRLSRYEQAFYTLYDEKRLAIGIIQIYPRARAGADARSNLWIDRR